MDSSYIEKCRLAYNSTSSLSAIDNFTVREYAISQELNSGYIKSINELKDISEFIFSKPSHFCYVPPNVDQSQDNFLRSKYFLMPAINDIASYIAPIVERDIYCTNSIVDGAYLYSTIPKSKEIKSSFNWHFDHYSKHRLKVMIYLSNVECVRNGPFAYLYDESNGSGFQCIDESQTLKGKSRLDESFIKTLCEITSYRVKNFFGSAGDFAIFSSNIIHRATLPAEGHSRTSLVLSFRPYPKNAVLC